MFVNLTRGECYTDITTFYKNVALRLGYRDIDDPNIRFDCRDICVTTYVRDVIASYYFEKLNASSSDFSMIWACFGPKAVLTANDPDGFYRAKLTGNFIIHMFKEEY